MGQQVENKLHPARGEASRQAGASAEQTVLPSRHGSDIARARSVALRLLRADGDQPLGPTSGAQWDLLGRGLLCGDEPADRLAAWLLAVGQKRGWAMFELALAKGVEQVESPPEELVDFFALVSTRPAWVRDELLHEGARVCALGGASSLRALSVNALLAGYQLSAINQTLLATGALERSTSKRIGETTKWWIDVTERGGMERFAEGFQNTLRVRMIHAMVRHRVSRQDGWDVAKWGVPVNQTDMQATYFGFSIVYLLGMRMMGITLSHDERAAAMHLWRYIAWLNGVDEPYLHALDGEERSATDMLSLNLLSQRMSDADCPRLGRALVDEPLQRRFKRARAVQGPLVRSLQLSIARLSMSTESLRGLGISPWQLPWYPLLVHPFHRVTHRLARTVPGGRAALVRLGRARQRAALAEFFGDDARTLGDVTQ